MNDNENQINNEEEEVEENNEQNEENQNQENNEENNLDEDNNENENNEEQAQNEINVINQAQLQVQNQNQEQPQINNNNNENNDINEAQRLQREEENKTFEIIKSKIKFLREKYDFCLQYEEIMSKILKSFQDLTFKKLSNSIKESLNFITFFKESSEPDDNRAYGRIEYKDPGEEDKASAVFEELRNRGWVVDDDCQPEDGWNEGLIPLENSLDFGDLYNDYRSAKRLVLATFRKGRGKKYIKSSADDSLSDKFAGFDKHKYYKLYSDLFRTITDGMNADLPNNLKKAFKMVGGTCRITTLTPKYVQFDGVVGDNYTVGGGILLEYLQGDARRYAEDLTMAYFKTTEGADVPCNTYEFSDWYQSLWKVDASSKINASSSDEVLYVIKDSHGNQLSRPNPNDNELWDRVDAMEARGRKGLCVVVYTGE